MTGLCHPPDFAQTCGDWCPLVSALRCWHAWHSLLRSVPLRLWREHFVAPVWGILALLLASPERGPLAARLPLALNFSPELLGRHVLRYGRHFVRRCRCRGLVCWRSRPCGFLHLILAAVCSSRVVLGATSYQGTVSWCSGEHEYHHRALQWHMRAHVRA